ncbi:MAG: hypothetical protein MPJ24_08785, partial [Pirellulaceae bacterium]|nr:hypothetical protein [Pirellulaceae bacterium]
MRQVFLVLLAVGIMMVECPVWVLAQDGTSWQGQGNRVASTTTSLDTGVSSGKAVASGTLPRGAGQVFREYDISQYTSKVQGVEQPQQAVIDWVMRQTGTEVWFGEPFGFLSATREKILVYHTPEMQKIVAEIVDRFAQGAQESNVFGLRLIALDSPDWRAMGQTKLTPVSVQTPGVDAWLVSKEDAAMLLAALRRRTDFREHSSPSLAIHNGQTHTLSQKQPRTYVRGVQPRLGNLGGYDLVMGQVFEGFKLEMSPL